MEKLHGTLSKLLGKTAGVAIFAGLVLATGAAESATLVNCDNKGSISETLEQGETDLIIKGICEEAEIEITGDDVTLRGHPSPSGGTVSGTIIISGAQRTIINDLTVTGDGYGIVVTSGATASIRDSSISGNKGDAGLSVNNNSFVRLRNTDILDNCENDLPENGSGTGIDIGMEGVVRGSDNTITGNCGPGIDVFRRGSYRSEGDTITQGDDAPWAIYLDRDSFMELRDSDVTGNITVNRMSQMHLRFSSEVLGDVGIPANGDIFASVQSQVIVEGGSTVEGEIHAESLSYASGAACDPIIDATSICSP